MKPFQLNRRGVSILSVIVGSLVMLLSFWAYVMFQDSVMKAQRAQREKYYAKLFAMELSEFFRGFNSSGALLRGFLSMALPVKPFCKKINKLDRTLGVLANPEPLARMPANYLDGEGATLKSNRYFQVDVINVTTAKISAAHCAEDAADVTLGANERFLITVGVSWIPNGKLAADETFLEVPSILPGL